jgi:hypothetical protein
MYAAFFGSQIYSHIPKGLGGSRALTITLMRKAATVNEASVRMGPVSMVQESEKSVALLCTSDSGKMATLIVNRDNIEAIETGADSPPPTPLCSSLRR